MDDKRFDSLTRALASGQSRRSVIKGLLGLGGAAAVSTVLVDDTDARRSSITTPTTTPRPTTTTTLPPCAGTRCGKECCDDPLQCCDGECCGGDQLCVARVLDCSNSRCEEICCDDDQICDGRCCSGTCFEPFGGVFAADDDDDDDDSRYERDCCPAAKIYCPSGFDPGVGVCCEADQECCVNPDGSPVCINPATQCCNAGDCVELNQGEEACWVCNPVDNFCDAIPRGEQGNCPDCEACSGVQTCLPNPNFNGDQCDGVPGASGGNGVCCDGTCVLDGSQFFCPGDNVCCDTQTESCCDGACCGGECLRDNQPEFCCETGLTCVVSTGPGQCCANPEAEKCCGDAGCCDGQCFDNDNQCCPSGTNFVCTFSGGDDDDDDDDDACCTRDQSCCAVDGCCTGSCNDAGRCCQAGQTFACGIGCCDNATEKCCDGVCISASLCCPSLPDCQEPNETCCGGACVDTDADATNCGDCGVSCASLNDAANCLVGVCNEGVCGSMSTCTGNQVCDGQGMCVNPTTTTPSPTTTTPQPDPCEGITCVSPEICDDGACRCGSGPGCSDGDVCCQPPQTSGLVCIDVTPGQFCCESADCGDTGNPCTRYDCIAGGCVEINKDGSCGQGLACCNGTCTPLGTPDNCGFCGDVCTAYCNQGTCCVITNEAGCSDKPCCNLSDFCSSNVCRQQ